MSLMALIRAGSHGRGHVLHIHPEIDLAGLGEGGRWGGGGRNEGVAIVRL